VLVIILNPLSNTVLSCIPGEFYLESYPLVKEASYIKTLYHSGGNPETILKQVQDDIVQGFFDSGKDTSYYVPNVAEKEVNLNGEFR